MAANISLAFLLSFLAIVVPCQSIDFIYNGFNQTNLTKEGATIRKPSGALRLTNESSNVIGHAFYPQPIQLFNSSFPNISNSFSTYFVFAIVPKDGNRGGYGLAFTLSPSPEFPGAEGDHYLGIFNSKNDGNDSNHILAVEFDTMNGHKEQTDTEGNHIGINVNGMASVESEPAAYYKNDSDDKAEMRLESGDRIQALIEYHGVKKELNVTIWPESVSKPTKPLISRVINQPDFLKESMYVGFSAATGSKSSKSSSHYILGWSFRVNGRADELDLSRLPTPPKREKSSSLKTPIKAILAVLSIVTILLFGVLILAVIYRRRRMYSDDIEDWELDCPHRFRYNDLYKATRGFKQSEILGEGGFGVVYKGVLPTTGAEVAVKKVSNDSIQGIREFAAEIESLGRLRHKNLVNLQGWCKRKKVLLLVYDYVPNGSLGSLLLKPESKFLLRWDQRFNIIKGIANGLLYLHEEWEKVVIHRDVKSSNVLIDAEMNGRLGDFGLARLYDHGKVSHTTNVVGTIGYIAPELAQTGKASTSSDVFAYGVLLLEVASGRGPIVDHHGDSVTLVAWVIECLQTGQILDAADPKLSFDYAVEEMELVLGLGLICCHPRGDARPTMRQVTRYLAREEPLPLIDNLSSFRSQQADEFTSKYLEVISTDTISSSYCSL